MYIYAFKKLPASKGACTRVKISNKFFYFYIKLLGIGNGYD